MSRTEVVELLKWRAFGLLLLCIPLLATACGSSESAPLAPGTAAATVAVADVAKPTAPTGASPTRAASPLVSSTRSAAGAATPTAPRATPATASTPAATARPDTATPPSTGAVPTGWQTYDGGARVPFTIAYPPDWTVDDSRATQGRVYIYGPGVTQPFEDALWLLIATTGNPAPDANIDVLRDQYFATEIKDPHPEAGIDVTRRNEFSGLPFASLGTTFNSGTVLCYAYIGLAVRDGVPWRFRLNSPYADYSATLEGTFAPMIGALHIYGNP